MEVKTKIRLNKHTARLFNEAEAIVLLSKYEDAINIGNMWEIGLETRYDEDQIESIMGMLSYMENKYNGFGHRNDEWLYKENKNSDVTGQLYQEACHAFNNSKQVSDLRDEIQRKNIQFTFH